MSTKIEYELANGQVIEIEVPDEIAEVTVELEAAARRQGGVTVNEQYNPWMHCQKSGMSLRTPRRMSLH